MTRTSAIAITLTALVFLCGGRCGEPRPEPLVFRLPVTCEVVEPPNRNETVGTITLNLKVVLFEHLADEMTIVKSQSGYKAKSFPQDWLGIADVGSRINVVSRFDLKEGHQFEVVLNTFEYRPVPKDGK